MKESKKVWAVRWAVLIGLGIVNGFVYARINVLESVLFCAVEIMILLLVLRAMTWWRERRWRRRTEHLIIPDKEVCDTCIYSQGSQCFSESQCHNGNGYEKKEN